MGLMINTVVLAVWAGLGGHVGDGLAVAPELIIQENPATNQDSGVAELTIDPSEVKAGMFFDGASVHVSVVVPGEMGIAMSLVGTEAPVTLNRKGKALGLIWMNVGEVEVSGAPNLYLLNTSASLHDLGLPMIRDAVGVGYESLEDRVSLEVPDGPQGGEDLFGEFVSLKESDGLYTQIEGAVTTERRSDGTVLAETVFDLPPKTPAGAYRILVHGFSGGEGLLLGSGAVRLEQVGVAASIRSLAYDHGLAYGILAVVVAIVVGLLTGVLFGLGSKKAH